ncbi:MAG: DUF4886 domain-containing protein [Bacteroidota bacterium]
MSWRHYLLALFIFCAVEESTAQQTVPENVLFIGNSYTYFWNLPQLVEIMCESQSIDLKTRQSTSGGVSLGTHWRGERFLQSAEKIKSEQFDAVVFQDHSRRSIDHPDSLLYFGKLWCDLAQKHQAETYLYMTWARAWNPLMQEKITAGYQKLAAMTQSKIVPVGPAWAYAKTLRPDLQLYDPDGSHPSTIGTYLSACVFFAVLTGKSPVGLPARLVTKDKNNDPLYLMIISPNDAQFCQEVADKIVKKMKAQ